MEGPQTPPRLGTHYRTDIRTFKWYVKDKVLYYFDSDKLVFRRIYACEDWEQKEKERLKQEPSPMDDFMEICRRIKKYFHKGITDIWGCADRFLWGFVKCVPSQISWYNTAYSNDLLDDIYKADVSSAFPYEACKRLPTLIDHKIVYSYDVEPTEEYPFVFFNNGRVLFLEEDGTIVDSEEFKSSKYYNTAAAKRNYEMRKSQYNYPSFKEDMCLCCKAGPSLKAIMEEIYKQKLSGNEHAKLLMNRFIGYCWLKRQPSYFHLAAVIIARCDNRMVEMARRLLDRGEIPLLIATDSIMWKGKDDEVEQLVKMKGENTQLGDLCWEAYNAEAIIAGSKCYQIRHSNGKVKTIWSGVNKEVSDAAAFGDVAKYTDTVLRMGWNGDYIRYPSGIFGE